MNSTISGVTIDDFPGVTIDDFQLPWLITEDSNFQANTDFADPFVLSGSDLDFNFEWDPLNDDLSPLSPVAIPSEAFPPSPAISVDNPSPTMDGMSLEEYLVQSTDRGLNLYTPSTVEAIPHTIVVNTSTPPCSNHSSPLESTQNEPMTPESPKSQSPDSPLTTPTIPPRRRGPGRPSKAEQMLEGKKPSARALMTMRRRFHNDSATRSRARFNNVLTELWNEIPEAERTQFLGSDDPGRQLCRAEKIETVISYIRKLQRTLHLHGLQIDK